jgi:hypothetical protein
MPYHLILIDLIIVMILGEECIYEAPPDMEGSWESIE